MMKKRIALLLCLLLAAAAIPCLSLADEEITLELWYWQSSLNDELLEKVSEQFPGVKINANKFNSETMEEKFMTALASDAELPDIAVMDSWVVNVKPYADKFINMYDEPYNAAQYKDQYVEWKWNLGETADGKLIGFPIDAGPTVLFYRADLFEAAGLPSDPEEVAKLMGTWEGALEAAKQMKEKTGVYMFDFVNNLYWMMIQSCGQNLVDVDNKFIGDSDVSKNCFYTAAKFADYTFGMDDMYGTEWATAMNNGDVAAYCSAVWTIDMLKNDAPDTAGQWRVTAQPGAPGNYGGSCLGIPASCKHPDVAFQVITWLENAQNQMIQLKNNSLFPTNLETLASDEMLVADPFFGDQVINTIFIDATKNVPPQDVGLHYNAYRQYFYDELLQVQFMGKDIDKAWEDAITACKALEATF